MCVDLAGDPTAWAPEEPDPVVGAPPDAAVPGEKASDELCQELFAFCQKEMAYYKVPGWWWFTDEIPTTGTQKIQKHRILATGQDPTSLPGIRDLRAQKKR